MFTISKGLIALLLGASVVVAQGGPICILGPADVPCTADSQCSDGGVCCMLSVSTVYLALRLFERSTNILPINRAPTTNPDTALAEGAVLAPLSEEYVITSLSFMMIVVS